MADYVDIPGATSPTYQTPALDNAYDGDTFRAIITDSDGETLATNDAYTYQRMHDIHYAVEIVTDATTVTDAAYGCVAGTFRFITDRPGYSGVGPNFPLNEDDTQNTYIWYEGWIINNGVGNPNRQISIDVSGEYGTMSGFSFAIRNDTKFWEFLKNNNIYLTNRQVKLYAVYGDKFYQVWDGVCQDSPYDEVQFKLVCIDKFRSVHKQIPPNLISNVTDETSTAEAIPIALGDVAYSKLVVDKDNQTEYQTLWVNSKGVEMTHTAAYNAGLRPEHTRTPIYLTTQTSDPVVAGAYYANDVSTTDTVTTASISVSNADGAAGKVINTWVTNSYLDDIEVQHWRGNPDYYVKSDYNFTFYAHVSSLTDPTYIVWDMIKKDYLGTETVLFSTSQTLIDSTTVKAYTFTHNVSDTFCIVDIIDDTTGTVPDESNEFTTRWKFRVYFKPRIIQNTSATAVTATLTYGGTYKTIIDTPLIRPPYYTEHILLWIPGNLDFEENHFKNMYLFAVAGGGENANEGYKITWSSPPLYKTWTVNGVYGSSRWFYIAVDRAIVGFEESEGEFAPETNTLEWIGPNNVGTLEPVPVSAETTVFRIGKCSVKGIISESDITNLEIDPETNLPYLFNYDEGTKAYIPVETMITDFKTTTDNDVGHPYIELLPNLNNIVPIKPTFNYLGFFGHDKKIDEFLQADFDAWDAYDGTYSTPASDKYSYNTGLENITDFDKRTEYVLPATAADHLDLTVKLSLDITPYLNTQESMETLYFGIDAYIYNCGVPVIAGTPSPTPSQIHNIRMTYSRIFRLKDVYGNTIELDDNYYNNMYGDGPDNNIPSIFTSYSSPKNAAITMKDSKEWSGVWQSLPQGYYLSGSSYNTTDAFKLTSCRWSVFPDDIFNFIKNGLCSSEIEIYITFRYEQLGYWDTYIRSGAQVVVKQFGIMSLKKTDVKTSDLYCRLKGESTSDGSLYTNNVYTTFKKIMEDYDGISKSQIDYTNLPTVRNEWFTSRNLTERRSSFDYINELAKQSFVCVCPTRKGYRRLVAWRDYTDNPKTHDGNVIVRDSIKDYTKTALNRLYNNFRLKYSWSPAPQIFDRTLYIDRIWEDAFPSDTSVVVDPLLNTSITWRNYVGGVTYISYADAKVLWDICHESYVNHKTITDKLPADLSDLYWYHDVQVFDPDVLNGSGVDSSAYRYLTNLVEWVTRQKDIVSYSIPITEENLQLELLDPIIFNDAIYTHSVDRPGWITGYEIDTTNDRINIESTLEPYNIETLGEGIIVERGTPLNDGYTIDESGSRTDTVTEQGVL